MEVIFHKYSFRPNDQFYYDTDVINDHIQYKLEFSQWNEKFESTGNEFIYIFMCCLFYTKSKTLSHLRESLNFYTDTVSKLINTKEKQQLVLKALYQIWSHSSCYLKMIIEFLLNKCIIDYFIMIEFILNFVKDSNEYLPFQFELIDYIIKHSSVNLEKMKKELFIQQDILSLSDENIQTDLIKNIENLENNIENLKENYKIIHKESYNLFWNYFKDKDLFHERIIEFARKYDEEIGININNIKY